MKNLSIIALVAPFAFAAVSAQAAGPETASADATSSVKIIQPIAVAKNTDLAFGTIVKPATGNGSVSVNTAGVRTASNGATALSSTTPSKAKFTISGEGAQYISVSVPGSFDMSNTTTNNANDKLTVTTSNDITGAANNQQLSGTLGGSGSLEVNVGGSFSLPAATATGNYSGTFTVSASYN